MMTEKQCRKLIEAIYGRQKTLTTTHRKLDDFRDDISRAWCDVFDGVNGNFHRENPAAVKFDNAISTANKALADAMEALRELDAYEWGKLIRLYKLDENRAVNTNTVYDDSGEDRYPPEYIKDYDEKRYTDYEPEYVKDYCDAE